MFYFIQVYRENKLIWHNLLSVKEQNMHDFSDSKIWSALRLTADCHFVGPPKEFPVAQRRSTNGGGNAVWLKICDASASRPPMAFRRPIDTGGGTRYRWLRQQLLSE